MQANFIHEVKNLSHEIIKDIWGWESNEKEL